MVKDNIVGNKYTCVGYSNSLKNSCDLNVYIFSVI